MFQQWKNVCPARKRANKRAFSVFYRLLHIQIKYKRKDGQQVIC